jgi:hypothetical protein
MNVRELRAVLAELRVDPKVFSLDGGFPTESEGVVLGKEGARWHVRYFERGRWLPLGDFDSEDAACRKVLECLKDPGYRLK